MWTKLKPESTLVRLMKGGCRTISNTVVTDVLSVSLPTMEECDEWSRLVGEAGVYDPGQISPLGFGTSLVTPEMHQVLNGWLTKQGIGNTPRKQEALPLACIGAAFHHDADSYDDEVFCVLWLSEDVEWDLYFPHIDVRIPLVYGTIVLFDSAQPHGVVARGATTFDSETLPYATGTFISQDLLINRTIRARMGIQKMASCGKRGFAQLNREGYREELDEETGSWSMRKVS